MEFAKPRKKKVDLEALNSPIKRIPGIDLPTVRDLIDLGFRRVDELSGRSPEALYQTILKNKPETPIDRLWMLRLGVYFAETPDPEPSRLQFWCWKDGY
jgi:hypothetical protein